MPSRTIGLFLEDVAQEQYVEELVRKILAGKGFDVEFRPFVSRGGRPAVFSELRTFFRIQSATTDKPDYIVVGNDGNCQGFSARRDEVLKYVPAEWIDRVILAIPDPHIEAWLLRDLQAFHRAVGPCGAPPAKKCSKDVYKDILRQRTIEAIGLAPLGGVENTRAIVAEQDINHLKQSGTDLRSFITRVDSIG